MPAFRSFLYLAFLIPRFRMFVKAVIAPSPSDDTIVVVVVVVLVQSSPWPDLALPDTPSGERDALLPGQGAEAGRAWGPPHLHPPRLTR